jgi:hypothetical protein
MSHEKRTSHLLRDQMMMTRMGKVRIAGAQHGVLLKIFDNVPLITQ